ncbi:hypothetical protein GCM10010466_65530 [Planomonospora alba]|uniref:Peptidase M48 domain-containing protein n=1 Tax=Planomonospora alba TaxID=161354 RepID=A0ABP6P2M9_9ACTN
MTVSTPRLAPFDPAAVRTVYAPAVTRPALPGLADLASALAEAAHRPGVLVTVDPGLEDGALIHHADGCGPTPRVVVGAALLDDGDRLAGVLAHEIAHHALDHGTGAVQAWAVASYLAAGTALATAAIGVIRPPYLIASAVAAVVAALAYLVAAACRRLEEYDADTYSVRLLDEVGLDGRAAAEAALAAIPDDPWWYRTVGWIAGSHPTAAARRRNLATGRWARPRAAWR